MVKMCGVDSPFVSGIVFLLSLEIVAGARILAVFPRADINHDAAARFLLRELAANGHQITLYTSSPTDWLVNNVEKIIVPADVPAWTAADHSVNKLPVTLNLNDSEILIQQTFAQAGANGLEHFLSQKPIVELIKQSTVEFNHELLIFDMLFGEALLALAAKFRIPAVPIVISDLAEYMEHTRESYVLGTSSTQAQLFMKINYAAQQRLIAKHFPNVTEPLPTLLQSISVLLLNNYSPLAPHSILLPNSIYVGGIHVGDIQPLQWDVLRFVDEARNGIIYVQLGNREMHVRLPEAVVESLLVAFGKRKERVIWSYYGKQKLPNTTRNVLLHYQTPQSSILAHPRVRAFITNGDAIAVQSAMMRNVPIIGISTFSNEHRNMDTVVSLGIGLKLTYEGLSAKSLLGALSTVVDNRNFKLMADKIGVQYRDRLAGPAMAAKHYINYVLKHKDSLRFVRAPVTVKAKHLPEEPEVSSWLGLPFVILICAACIILFYVLVMKYNNGHIKEK